MFSDLIFAFSGFGLLIFGIVIGWWLKPVPKVSASGDDSENLVENREALIEMATKIQNLTQEVARDVGEHNSRVEEINNELNSADADDHDSVVLLVERLVKENQEMQNRLNSADEKLQQQAEELASQTEAARTDTLTGLPNRRAFEEEVQRLIEEFKLGSPPFSLVMVDVDRFKTFNDTYGHQTGDHVLEMLGEVLRATARDTDMPVRLGGEEFTVLLPATEVDSASSVADRIRKTLEKSEIKADGKTLSVTASFGVAQSLQGEDADSILRRADEALYEAKENGRNNVHMHDGNEIKPFGDPNETETSSSEETSVKAESDESTESTEPTVVQESTESTVVRESADAKSVAQADHSEKLEETDDLTDQPIHIQQRTQFIEVLGCRMDEWRRGGPVPSVLMVKIDNLPALELLHGPAASKIAVEATRKFLQAVTRDMDFAALYDVGEFSILFPGAGKKNTIDVAMRIKDAISRCRIPLGEDVMTFTVSEGVAEAFGDDTSEDLIRRARSAMKAAANAGGNYCNFHNGQKTETIKPPIKI